METPREVPIQGTSRGYLTLLAVIHWTRFVLLFAGGLLLLLLFVGYDIFAPQGQARPPDHVALDIMPVKPGGPAQNFAAYVPTTVLNVPANSIVTVTIRNFDLDATPMTAGSPFTHVQGTVGGIAYADGKAYTMLDQSGVAHTFTVPALHLNVPIPGYAASGARYVTVTFRMHTGKAGTYPWRCFAPCGEGADGQAGPMADASYMRGILFVAD